MRSVLHTLGGSGGGTFGLIIVLDLLKNENNGGFDNILKHNNNTVHLTTLLGSNYGLTCLLTLFKLIIRQTFWHELFS